MGNRIRLALNELYLKVRKKKQQILNIFNNKAKFRVTYMLSVNSLCYNLTITFKGNMGEMQRDGILNCFLQSGGFCFNDRKSTHIPSHSTCDKAPHVIPKAPTSIRSTKIDTSNFVI